MRVYWLAGGLLLLFSVVSYRSSNQLIESFEWVGHTHQVLESLQRIELLHEQPSPAYADFSSAARTNFSEIFNRTVTESRQSSPQSGASPRTMEGRSC